MSSNTKSQIKDSSSFSGLPLPQFEPNSVGGRVHQKPQKYPDRSVKISIEDDFSYNNNVTSAPTLIKMGQRRIKVLISDIQCSDDSLFNDKNCRKKEVA